MPVRNAVISTRARSTVASSSIRNVFTSPSIYLAFELSNALFDRVILAVNDEPHSAGRFQASTAGDKRTRHLLWTRRPEHLSEPASHSRRHAWPPKQAACLNEVVADQAEAEQLKSRARVAESGSSVTERCAYETCQHHTATEHAERRGLPERMPTTSHAHDKAARHVSHLREDSDGRRAEAPRHFEVQSSKFDVRSFAPSTPPPPSPGSLPVTPRAHPPART